MLFGSSPPFFHSVHVLNVVGCAVLLTGVRGVDDYHVSSLDCYSPSFSARCRKYAVAVFGWDVRKYRYPLFVRDDFDDIDLVPGPEEELIHFKLYYENY